MSDVVTTPEVMNAYTYFYTGAAILLGIILLACLIRAAIGPRIADRLISINMMSTVVVILILILGFLMGEGYLTDVALIYTMLSFLAVILLTKIYVGVYRGKRHIKKEAEENDT